MFCCGLCVLNSPTTLPLFVLALIIALLFICLLFSLPMAAGFFICSLSWLLFRKTVYVYLGLLFIVLLDWISCFPNAVWIESPASWMQCVSLVLHLLPKSRVCRRYNMWGFGCLKGSFICYPSTDNLVGDRLFFFGFCLFRAPPVALGGSQARGPIGAVAAGLHHSHSHARSEPYLWPTPQLRATPGP